jgi:hypothetical protein
LVSAAVIFRRWRGCLAPKKLHESFLHFLYLAFYRKKVDAVDAPEKNLLADFELRVVFSLRHEQGAVAISDEG